ncbi:prolyl oligopeptidase family serine peptidase [Nonomuraea sp. NPDC050404]|uniref:prolyl oligopeptidase family serine peptidase n=1 Tax=Nonomuraea sp. NPDC050404 TaxID=3155783 RepID=UPI0033C80272
MKFPDNYPPADRLPLTEHRHGHEIDDPYRWLEDPLDSRTQDWLTAQDRLWHDSAARLARREPFLARLTELRETGLVTPPVWRGDQRFHLRQSPTQEHPVLCRDDRVVLDPMELDPTGLTTLDDWQPDLEGRRLAYQISRSGDEKACLYVRELATGEIIDGPIGGCRYSAVAWLPGGEEFYYVLFRQGVFLHRIGSSEPDVPVFTRGPIAYGVQLSPDGRWLTISAGTASGNSLWLADLAGEDPAPRPVQEGSHARTAGAVACDGRLYLLTDRDAPRRRLCVAHPETPTAWRELIPEDKEAVLGAFTLLDGDRLLVSRTRHAVGEIVVHHAHTGERLGTVPLPGSGSIASLTSRPEGGPEAWFAYTDAVTPAEIWRYDARTDETTRWSAAPGRVTLPAVHSHHIEYTSADGTPIRMVVVAQPSDGGPRPAILSGYGGFGIPLMPGYAADSLAWVEAGGVLAIANLRGGGEEGEAWHRDGMLERKQNVFDDFVAAAEKLIADGWTTPRQLGIWGESNGGLLVGAALTQRPDLFAAVVCSAGLLDMARYHLSGLGPSWTGEYGDPDDPEHLAWLLGYSPYHHVGKGTDFPATLFTVSAADTRVDPMHARKMCAALQWATGGDRPILLRHEPDVGHGARAVSRSVGLAADVLAFLAAHTNGSDPS